MFAPYLWSRACSPARRIRIRSNPSKTTEVPPATSNAFRIASYNIAHGRGLPFDNWNGESRDVRLKRLDAIADLLKEIDADIVVLNEVDFESSWSHKINQAEYLAEKSGYAYWVEGRNLDFRVVHYMWRFGNAVLSRYPIAEAEIVDLPSYKKREVWLAGKKRAVLATLDVPGDENSPAGKSRINVVAAHLSHRSEDVRELSAQMLCEIAKDSSVPTFIVGDLNSTPPNFPSSNSSDDGRNAMATFDASDLFYREPMTPPKEARMTFPANNANQVIDWILVPRRYRIVNYAVVKSELSDHRPVSAEVELAPL